MFDNNTGIFHYNYQLELETIINAICNISFDIGIQMDNIEIDEANEIEYAKELFEEDLFKFLSIRKSDLEEKDGSVYIYTKEAFFSEISNYYNKSIFLNPVVTDYLKGSDIFLINKTDAFFYASDEKSAKARVISAIKNGKILNDIIDKIKNIKIKNSLNKINLFEHNAFYGNTIKTFKQEGQPIIPFINFASIDSDKVNIELEDFDKYWINEDIYKTKYGINLSLDAERYLVTDKANNDVLGLLIGEYLIPYSNVDLVEYILEISLVEYFWLLLQSTYSVNTNKAQNTGGLVEDFKKQNKNKELNQLLSYLKNNLYLDSRTEIAEVFEGFFNKVALIEKLDYLEEYEFLIPQSTEEEIALGIYSKEKKGTSYNLLHWLNHKKERNVSHFRGNIPTKKDKLPISTLKPEICFYFLEKYFEDLLDDIFKANKYEYLSNIKLSRKSPAFDCEIDFFVYAKNKFYYIEAKTKLSKSYIEGFLKKASDMMDKFNTMLLKGIEVEFILLGGYSDENVKDFQYFIDSVEGENEEGYNVKREKLNSIPYNFTVPIPDKKGKEIICIAEPEYDKLEKLVLKICQK